MHKKGIARLQTSTGGSAEAAASVTRRAKLYVSPSVPRSHRLGAAPILSSSIGLSFNVALSADFFTILKGDVSNLAESDLGPTDPNSNCRLLGTS